MSLLRSPAPPASPVQSIGRRGSDIERRPLQSAGVFLAFWIGYSVVGYWLVTDVHVVGFDALDRLQRAVAVLHDDPAKLASIGTDHPPLAVLLLLPVAVVPAAASSLAVLPVASAGLAALAMMAIHTMMRRARVGGAARALVLVALGLNPLVVLYAANGATTFLWLGFVVTALGSLLAWYVTADLRFVLLAGLAFAAAVMAGYGSLVWFVAGIVVIAVVLARLGAGTREVEGTTIGFGAPTLYAVGAWAAYNLVLVSDPLAWLALDGGVRLPPADVLSGTFALVWYGAPLALVVLPVLVHAAVVRRNGFAACLAGLLVLAVAAPALGAALGTAEESLALRDALPILLVAVIGAIWLARSAITASGAVAGLLAIALLVSIPWTFSAMADYPRQGLERAFHDAVLTGESQEGTSTVDGAIVGYAAEQEAADWLERTLPPDATVLTDDARTYAVVLLTGRPATFLGRVDGGLGSWRDAVADPAASADYLLLSTDVTRDDLSARYPAAATGSDPALPQLFGNQRYVVVAVPDDFVGADRAPDAVSDPADRTGTGDTSTGSTSPGDGVGGIVGQGAGTVPPPPSEAP